MTVSAVHCPLKNRQLQCNVDAPNNDIVKMQRYGNNIKTTGPCVLPGCIFDSLQTKQNVKKCALRDGRQFCGFKSTLMVFSCDVLHFRSDSVQPFSLRSHSNSNSEKKKKHLQGIIGCCSLGGCDPTLIMGVLTAPLPCHVPNTPCFALQTVRWNVSQICWIYVTYSTGK